MILGAVPTIAAGEPRPDARPQASGITPALIGGAAIDAAIVSLVDRKKHPFWWWFGMIGLAMNSATIALQLGRKS